MTTNETPVEARRKEVKERYDLIPAVALEALAAAMGKGAVEYGDRNYLNGLPGHKSPLNHIGMHYQALLAGDESEDHLGHIMANCAMELHLREVEERMHYENAFLKHLETVAVEKEAPAAPEPQVEEDHLWDRLVDTMKDAWSKRKTEAA
jgi:hypothetical protein